jgi:16S rRNA (cytosine967-C5)-methyltransferase
MKTPNLFRFLWSVDDPGFAVSLPLLPYDFGLAMHAYQFTQATELLTAVLAGTIPADAQMDRYFRAHPKMGSRDRGFVAEAVYACLRRKRVLEHLAQTDEPAALVAAQLLSQGLSARALEETGFQGDVRALAARVRTLDNAALAPAVRANLPDWLAEKLLAQFGETGMLELAAALNRPAPLDIRANTVKIDRDPLRARLEADGYAFEPTPYSPVGLRRADRASLFGTKSFKEGLFEVQDEGSQLLSLLLEPKRREMVVDFCAGAGGKTLHLGALMANSGTLYAFDVAAHRLERLTPRLARAGLSNVRTVAIRHENDDRVQRLHGKIDRVLVDAPCSGTGTLRRNPDIKWRPLDLATLTATQRKILAAAAALLKSGGRLVYATCSLLPEENEAIVADFLAGHPGFQEVPAGEILARRHVTLPEGATTPHLHLFPHRHGTDGFFAAVLERQG